MIDALVDSGFSAKRVCRILGVSRQGFYRYRHRPMSPTMMRREWLTALIRQVHAESRGTYGSRRVRAELIHGRGIRVSERLVWLLTHNAGIHGFLARPRPARSRGYRRATILSSGASPAPVSTISGSVTSRNIPRGKGRSTVAA